MAVLLVHACALSPTGTSLRPRDRCPSGIGAVGDTIASAPKAQIGSAGRQNFEYSGIAGSRAGVSLAPI
jgi:hypothetical protein